jgi:hypothetical protein
VLDIDDAIAYELFDLAIALEEDHEAVRLGHTARIASTDHGLPIEVSIDIMAKRYGIGPRRMARILLQYQFEMIEHKRMSGSSEQTLDNTRARNLEDMIRFLKHGEIY